MKNIVKRKAASNKQNLKSYSDGTETKSAQKELASNDDVHYKSNIWIRVSGNWTMRD